MNSKFYHCTIKLKIMKTHIQNLIQILEMKWNNIKNNYKKFNINQLNILHRIINLQQQCVNFNLKMGNSK